MSGTRWLSSPLGAIMALALGTTAMGAGACGGGSKPSASAGASASAARPAAPASAPVASASASAGDAVPAAVLDFQEYEFNESERSRDPFRSFEEFFVAESKSRVESQREVLLDEYALDDLTLVGIVQRANPALAMLVDPTGKGHTVRRGQFVGRAEVVQSPGQRGAAYEINWRVDRIRDGDVVFVREDPQNPDIPSATKVIPLRPEGTLESDGQ